MKEQEASQLHDLSIKIAELSGNIKLIDQKIETTNRSLTDMTGSLRDLNKRTIDLMNEQQSHKYEIADLMEYKKKHIDVTHTKINERLSALEKSYIRWAAIIGTVLGIIQFFSSYILRRFI